MVAGYSGKPLVDKLGIPRAARSVVIHPPPGYSKTLGRLPEGATITERVYEGAPFIHLFTTSRAELAKRLPGLIKALGVGGMIWISWPKKSSGVATDLTEDVLREVALPLGIVDVKVAALDETWSGLKFYRRRSK